MGPGRIGLNHVGPKDHEAASWIYFDDFNVVSFHSLTNYQRLWPFWILEISLLVCCGLDFAKFVQFDPVWSTKLCDTETKWASIILTQIHMGLNLKFRSCFRSQVHRNGWSLIFPWPWNLRLLTPPLLFQTSQPKLRPATFQVLLELNTRAIAKNLANSLQKQWRFDCSLEISQNNQNRWLTND